MTDPIRDAAIEAAAKADYRARPLAWLGSPPEWEGLGESREEYRDLVTPLVDAVLAVVRPHFFELRKTAIREARAEALRDAADDLEPLMDDQHPDALNPDQWLRDRADEEDA